MRASELILRRLKMEETKLLLVYPEIKCSITDTHTYSLPLGLGSIATYCKGKMGEGLEVKILDGSMMSHKEQLKETKKFHPTVTGINSTIGNQKNAYEIARAAKDSKSLVIFGGVNSTNLWKNMLTNQKFIDGVVLYEGEIPMYLLLNRLKEKGILGNSCFRGIPNLAFREFNTVCEPDSIHVNNLPDLPDIDYSLFDLKEFFKQTQQKGFGKAVTYYAGKGCLKRGNLDLKQTYFFKQYQDLVNAMDVCSFCGRNELGLRNIGEDRETRVIRELHDRYDVRGFFNVQDTVELRNSSPIRINDSWFRLFIGTESITPENIERLKQRYGSNLIFQAGIEAVTPEMRRVYGKRETDFEDLTDKVKLMANEGIALHASFVLGGRGETKDSMRKTSDFAQTLAQFDNVTWILMSPQLILPGSPDYKALLQMPKMKSKYVNQDLIDIKEVSRDFLKYFTPELKREDILEEIKQTFQFIGKKERPALNTQGVPELVLDVKGVIEDEERYIKPHRPYIKN